MVAQRSRVYPSRGRWKFHLVSRLQTVYVIRQVTSVTGFSVVRDMQDILYSVGCTKRIRCFHCGQKSGAHVSLKTTLHASTRATRNQESHSSLENFRHIAVSKTMARSLFRVWATGTRRQRVMCATNNNVLRNCGPMTSLNQSRNSE